MTEQLFKIKPDINIYIPVEEKKLEDVEEETGFINIDDVNMNVEKDINISIEDDGPGYPRDIISKIGEPYLKSNYSKEKSKEGLGLGLFIGKTLLEKNFASVICRNSKTRSGAEVVILWKNKELFNI